ncbi:MAG: DUF3574 domain-containing protein [Hyphomicrobiaceae bacterium]
MKPTSIHTALTGLALALGAGGLWTGLARQPAPITVGCSADTEPYRRVELVFGLSRKGRPEVAEAEWQSFLDSEVTPRFPDGLSVLAASGQWRNASGNVIKEPARLLLVLTKPAPDLEARVAAVRAAWRKAHDQESVLRAEGASCVSF